jgi:2-polyprenyl-3-methyl-5-hydroxy-6-metoxy-1,4-benzoquinol methylase
VAEVNSVTKETIEFRERDFHNSWAKEQALHDILMRESFEAPTALEAGYILRRMGDIKGKRILDFGCGLGEAAVYFALQGAKVTAADLSPEMTKKALELAAFHNVTIKTVTGNAESLILNGSQFDYIYASNLIHHLQDKQAFFDTVKRLLAPGGVFFSWDPLTYNPVVWIYRFIASGVRTKDEYPLSVQDLSLIKKNFPKVTFKYFWLSGLLIFLKYFLVDALHPSKVRYWKHVLKENSHTLKWWKPLLLLDRYLTSLPLIRLFSWTVVVEARCDDK